MDPAITSDRLPPQDHHVLRDRTSNESMHLDVGGLVVFGQQHPQNRLEVPHPPRGADLLEVRRQQLDESFLVRANRRSLQFALERHHLGQILVAHTPQGIRGRRGSPDATHTATPFVASGSSTGAVGCGAMVCDLGLGGLSDAVVLVVHAHPDDEVFASGAATIEAKAAGATVHLRVFTGGEGRDSELTQTGLTAARLRKESRLAASTALLWIDTWGYLTEPGRWTDTPHALERTIADVDPGALAAPIVDAIETLRPDVLLTVGPDGLTGHPDHIACHKAVARALSDSRHTPRAALGAVLDRDAVVTAAHDAAVTFGETVGSGRVTGAPRNLGIVVINGPHETEPVAGRHLTRIRQLSARHLPPPSTPSTWARATPCCSGSCSILPDGTAIDSWRDRFRTSDAGVPKSPTDTGTPRSSLGDAVSAVNVHVEVLGVLVRT